MTSDSPVKLNRYVPALDGLRAIAVLLVIGFHANRLFRNGYLGVDCFFVLSGLLITSLLLAEMRDTRRLDVGAFYARRIRRLLPALAAVCATCVLISVAVGRHVSDVLAGALTSLLYVANFWIYAGHDTYLLQHTWTLALEEQFYLVWPVLIVWCTRRHRNVLVLLLIAAAVVTLDGFLGQPPVLHTYIRAAGLPIGCLLAYALQSESFSRVCGLVALPSLVVLIVLACLPTDLEPYLSGWPVSVAAVISVPVLAGLVDDESLISRILRVPLLVWIGQRSYGLYLWHFPVFTVALNNAPRSIPIWARIVAGLAVTVVVSAASYRLIERPALRRARLPFTWSLATTTSR